MTGFDPVRLLEMPPRETVARHDARDVMLYAVGVGVGIDDPTGDETLTFAVADQPAVLPTMATVLASPGFWQREPRHGIDWRRVLHAEQSLIIHRPLPVEGELVGRLTIEAIEDKGAAKGALLVSRRELHNRASGELLATERRVTFLRGDGGKGGGGGRLAAPHAVPDRAPDIVIALPTRPEQALLYRLSGDFNPIHADPAVARAAGLEQPILHGLCTYGVAGRALVKALCGGRPERLRRMDCRFTAPVYPGETIATSVWLEGEGRAAFVARTAERDVTVLANGYAEIAA